MAIDDSKRQGSEHEEEDDSQSSTAMESNSSENIEMRKKDSLNHVNEHESISRKSSAYDNPGFEHKPDEDVENNLAQANGKTSVLTIENGEEHQTDFFIERFYASMEQKFAKYCKKYRRPMKLLLLLAIIVVYFVYLGFAIQYSWHLSDSWCDGPKFLTIITIISAASVIYFYIIKKYFGTTFSKCFKLPFKILGKITKYRFFSIISFLVVMVVFLVFVIVDSNSRQDRLISYAGVWTLLVLGFIFSKHPGKVIIRHVAWGIGLQFVFALLILRWDVGKGIFECLGDKVAAFLAFTNFGADFMFNYLSSGKMAAGNATMDLLISDNETLHKVTAVNIVLPDQIKIFAFTVLPVVLYFSFCVSILYYYGIMQWIVLKVGWLLQLTVGTTAAESMNAAGNIFMGQTEAPLLVKPYLPMMTKSELHAIMTGGFATIAGSVLAAYISLGISASHLLSASVMSAPAALGFSKLFYPETEVSKTTISEIRIEKGNERNALEAATNGVTQAVGLVANIAANLIAFIAFIYFIDALIMWFGNLVGWGFLSLTYIMSYIFMPLSFMMGVKWEECNDVGKLIGYKTVINEFVAYNELGKMKSHLSCRAQIISTYALCGFSNLSSIGIQLGGLGAMAPNKMSDLAQVAFRAMVAGSCACFLTACVAGALIDVPENGTC